MNESNEIVCPYCLETVNSLQHVVEGSTDAWVCRNCASQTAINGDYNNTIGSYIRVGDEEEE